MTATLYVRRIARAGLGPAAAVVLIACSPPAAPDTDRAASTGEMMNGMPMTGGTGGDMMSQGGMMSDRGMMGSGMMQDMGTIHGLLSNHESIERHVEDLPNGVRTVTTSDDPAVAEAIRKHVRQMKARYARGQPIRNMDPMFRELFRNRDRASLEFEDIPGGIRVTHTSDNPNVVLLIRQHARRFVSEAAEQGMRRAMQPTPLPDGYRPPAG